jgi:formylglycine-generating enzyme required for sulfatase activity
MRARLRGWSAEQDAWPATWMTQEEAARFAAWRGMRLLVPGEWLFCALGSERRLFPWVAYERQDSVANTLELGLGRPCPVGTFEGGRTPRQVYDLLGNVAEWVAGDVLRSATPEGEPAAAGSDRPVSALGGSFRTWLRPIYRPSRAGDPPERTYLAYSLHPRSRQDDVGLRCAVPAATYLAARAPGWGDDPAVRARLVAIGRRWGAAAVPLLDELAARPGAARGLASLLEGARQ